MNPTSTTLNQEKLSIIPHGLFPIQQENWRIWIDNQSIEFPCCSYIEAIHPTNNRILDVFEKNTLGLSTPFIHYFGMLSRLKVWDEWTEELTDSFPQYIYSIPRYKEPNSIDPSLFFQICQFLSSRPKYPILATIFAAMVMQLGFIEKVVYRGLPDGHIICSVVNGSTQEQRYAIYDRQWELMQLFNEISIEFKLLDRHDTSLEELVTWSDQDIIIEM